MGAGIAGEILAESGAVAGIRLESGELLEAGVRIAFASGAGGGFGPSGPHGSRTLPYEANATVFQAAKRMLRRALEI